MALIDCSECGKQVSSAAASCPNCGHPISAQPGTVSAPPVAPETSTKTGSPWPKVLKVCGVLFVFIVVMKTCIGAGKKVAEEEPARAAVAGEPESPAIDVAADRLWADYDANEVTADGTYKGRRLAVYGVIKSIDKDIFGKAVLELVTKNMFQAVHATMKPSEMGRLSTLSKKQSIVVSCIGAGRIVGSPMLRDCSIDRVGD